MAASPSDMGRSDLASRPRTPPARGDSLPKQGSPLRFHDRESPNGHRLSYPSRAPLRKPLPIHAEVRIQGGPISPVQIRTPSDQLPPQAASAQIYDDSSRQLVDSANHSRTTSRDLETPDPDRIRDSTGPTPMTQTLPYRQAYTTQPSGIIQEPQMAIISSADSQLSNSPKTYVIEGDDVQSTHSSHGSVDMGSQPKLYPQLQYHHQQFTEGDGNGVGDSRYSHTTGQSSNSDSPTSSAAGDNAAPVPGRHLAPTGNVYPQRTSSRPNSAYSTVSDASPRGRTDSPGSHNIAGSAPYRRSPSTGQVGEHRPTSYVDLLNVPYHQQIAPSSAVFNNAHLRTAVGTQASLLSHKQTLDMYRLNVKKTNDPAIQYEFAVFMVSTAKEAEAAANSPDDSFARIHSHPRDLDSPYVDNSTVISMTADLYKEARQILIKLADRSYPFAQYYLADGYSSGLFTKGKPDLDKAFGLFVAAAKHGHAESGYRAGLCYEFGWGCRKDYAKAVQFYRQSASKNHPGSMLRLGKACLTNDLGIGNRYREGIKWLKRATESADAQYNSAPYELGVLHETGYGDDIFQDVTYAAQLFTQAAELGNAEANFRLGEAYEHGMLNCPRDAGLSVHFYTGAAQLGHAQAMMALCAWYIVGAEPVLEKNESEAYEWAKKAAELGLLPFLTP
jgi:TPR repeat protein